MLTSFASVLHVVISAFASVLPCGNLFLCFCFAYYSSLTFSWLHLRHSRWVPIMNSLHTLSIRKCIIIPASDLENHMLLK